MSVDKINKDELIKKYKELKKRKKELEKKLFDIEKEMEWRSYVSSVDFSSMYPSIIRFLNISIENLVGFLDDNPVAYRKLNLSEIVQRYMEKTQEERKKFKRLNVAKFSKCGMSDGDNRLTLRIDLYKGVFNDADIDEITETPFEKYMLGVLGLYDPRKIEIKFQGKIWTVSKLYKYFKKMNYSVAGSGAVFNRNKQGVVPSYLEYIYYERKKVKKKMESAFHLYQNLEKIKNIMKKVNSFD